MCRASGLAGLDACAVDQIDGRIQFITQPNIQQSGRLAGSIHQLTETNRSIGVREIEALSMNRVLPMKLRPMPAANEAFAVRANL